MNTYILKICHKYMFVPSWDIGMILQIQQKFHVCFQSIQYFSLLEIQLEQTILDDNNKADYTRVNGIEC